MAEAGQEPGQGAGQGAGFDWNAARTLPDFLADIPTLSGWERLAIVDAAADLLRGYYVHLPLKRVDPGVDPLAQLADLRGRAAALPDDLAFHAQLCGIFAGLRDLHTQYALPEHYRSGVALLPFKLGRYRADGADRYIVTDLLPGFAPEGHPDFVPGVEVTAWGGTAMEAAVQDAASRSGGASEDARRARGLACMTILPMERQAPPRPFQIQIAYRGAHGEARLTCAWKVAPATVLPETPGLARFVAMDHEGEIRRHVSKRAYHPRVADAEARAPAEGPLQGEPLPGGIPTRFPAVFEARPLAGTPFGYLRIHSFNPLPALPDIVVLIDLFLGEFVRLIEALPRQGLVLDVRGNGGGALPLAEALLQTMTPRPVSPQTLQLRATPQILALARRADDLLPYADSVAQALDAGSAYSAARPLSDPAWCNGIGQRYHGPVVLLVDARCYSATDAFAAGFQDHGIGPVLGVASATGAGGANVWTLPDFAAVPGSGVADALPHRASLRVALRRTRRVDPREGVLVEGVGVMPDHAHVPTLADLLHDDRDLLARACALLQDRPCYRLDAAIAAGALTVTTRNLDCLRAAGGARILAQDLDGAGAEAACRFALADLPGPAIVLQGYRGGRLVAARTVATGNAS